jgi:hypothetical protein
MAEVTLPRRGAKRCLRPPPDETVIDGIDHVADALGLFRGDNLGKMVVRLDGP